MIVISAPHVTLNTEAITHTHSIMKLPRLNSNLNLTFDYSIQPNCLLSYRYIHTMHGCVTCADDLCIISEDGWLSNTAFHRLGQDQIC